MCVLGGTLLGVGGPLLGVCVGGGGQCCEWGDSVGWGGR